jgi:hypothetical protein
MRLACSEVVVLLGHPDDHSIERAEAVCLEDPVRERTVVIGLGDLAAPCSGRSRTTVAAGSTRRSRPTRFTGLCAATRRRSGSRSAPMRRARRLPPPTLSTTRPTSPSSKSGSPRQYRHDPHLRPPEDPCRGQSDLQGHY